MLCPLNFYWVKSQILSVTLFHACFGLQQIFKFTIVGLPSVCLGKPFLDIMRLKSNLYHFKPYNLHVATVCDCYL